MGGSVVTFMSDRRMNYLAHGPVLDRKSVV